MELLQTPFAPRPKELDPVEGVGWGNRASLRLVSSAQFGGIITRGDCDLDWPVGYGSQGKRLEDLDGRAH